MPADQLSRILAEADVAWRREVPRAQPLTNIQWRADACDAGSVLFFQRLDDGRSDREVFQRYLAGRRFAVLVTNRMLDCFDDLAGKGIIVTHRDGWPELVRRCCDLLYPLDLDRLRFVGITGTNGKTTTVKYLEAILAARGARVLSIGTLGVFLDGERLVETGFTSPPLLELRRLLAGVQARCDLVVMEVSSHALDQGRLHGIPLAQAGWTNFSQDHLDYHHDEAAYFAAKAGILALIASGGRLFCASSAVAARLRVLASNTIPSPSPGPGPGPGVPAARTPPPTPTRNIPIEVVTPANLPAAVIAAKPFLALAHNRANYALALALADAVAPIESSADARAGWRNLQAVDGRFECQVIGNRTLVIDFAHTPEALDTILGAIREGFPTARIATLFGCGGDRDRSKRPLMGAAVARWSDRVFVTSDNPRTEDPAAIIRDILPGLAGTAHEVIAERPTAIARLFDYLAERPPAEPWVALIAGKGHERYIDQGGQKRPYSDQDEVSRNRARLGWD